MNNTTRVKLACYLSNSTMAIVSNLSPLLFITFRSLYDISYTWLGFLVLINFLTQLSVDVVFSFFSHKFNIPLTVRLLPVIACVGFVVYAAAPILFGENIYIGILLGTVIFSASSGLGEVLLSPIIAALPSDNPDREMSKLHSIYAWGCVGSVLFGSLFILFAGEKRWQIMTLIFTLLPLASFLMFAGAKLPEMKTPEKVGGVIEQMKSKRLWLFFFAIFLGGAAECTMAQWASSFAEAGLGIPKIYGDVFGVALFAVMLGLGRTLYAKFGKNITSVLLWGSVFAFVCYFVTALSPIPVISLVSLALTGFFVSMLWPGTLIAAEEKISGGGVFLYAILAAGGDMGAALGPQLVGAVTDLVGKNDMFLKLSEQMSLSIESLGMKLGILVGALFPLFAIALFSAVKNLKTKHGKNIDKDNPLC